MTEPPQTDTPRWSLHVLLFVVTFVTALLAGMPMGFEEGGSLLFTGEMPSWGAIFSGLTYAVPALAIILAHEMGHYLQCRRHRVSASPPFFLPGIPIPGLGVIPLIGTFGAFIRMELEPLEARKLLDVGAWGPLAGYIVSLPVLFGGYALSEIRPLPDEPTLSLGGSLLLLAGEKLFFGPIPEGHDIFLHPLAMAGWLGCLLTSLNLLPIGQLDGGHIAYTVIGESFNRIAPVMWVGLLALGVLSWAGWLVFALLVWVIGIRHPPMIVGPPVRGRGLWLAAASVVMLVTTFTLEPIEGGSLLELVELW